MKHRILIFAFSLFTILSFSNSTFGQTCTEVNAVGGSSTGVSGGAPGLGQSFIACQTGEITRIRVNVTLGGGATTLALSDGYGTLTPVYSESVTLTSGVNDITLATPYPVMAGNQYSFSLNGGSFGLGYNGGDPYANGANFRVFPNGSPTSASNRDLVFEVEFGPSSTPVPTMSEWGLILFGLTVLCVGGVAIRRSKMSFA